MTQQTAGRTAARGGAITLAGQGGKFLIQTAGLVVLARILAPSDYGRFAEITAIVGIASLLSEGGLSLAALQAKSLSQQQRSNLFWANALAGVVLGGLTMVAAYPLAAFYDDSSLVPMTQAVGLIFIISGMQTQFRAHVNGQLRFTRLAATDVTAALLGLLTAIAAGIAHFGTWALVLQQLVVTIASLALMASAARWRPSLPRRAEGMRALYTFGVNSLANQVLNYLSVNVASIMLGRVAGPAQLGYYTRAYTVFTLPMLQLASPITRVALPILSRDLDREVLGRRLVKAQTVLSWILVGIFLLLAGSADSFVLVAFGDNWGPAVPVFQMLAIGGVFQAIAYVYYWAFLSTARTRTQLSIVAPARVLMVALVFPLSTFGGVGVAASIAIGLFVIWLSNSTIGMRRIGLRSGPLVLAAARPCATFGVIAVAQQGLHRLLPGLPPIVELALSMALAAALLGLAALLVPPVRRDLALILSTARVALRRDGRRPSKTADSADERAEELATALVEEAALPAENGVEPERPEGRLTRTRPR